MILCVTLLWPSKIKSSLILMQNVFNVWALRTNWLKILFSEDLGWIQVFLKIFLSHTHAFYSYNNVLRGISAPKCYVFQKNDFSRFSINRTCCSTDRKCDKNFGFYLLGSIGARLVLDGWKLIFDQSNLIFNRSKIGQ